MLGVTILIGSVYVIVLPLFAQQLLELVLDAIDDIKTGSLLAAMAILFFPVTFLGMYSPFAIRLLLRSAASSGTVSGTVYGISTVGCDRRHARHHVLSAAVDGLALAHADARRRGPARRAGADRAAAVRPQRRGRGDRCRHCWRSRSSGRAGASAPPPTALVDEQVRADLLKRADGQVARIETEYNDIFITKRRNELTMSFQLKGWDYTKSVTNLRDPDDLPVHYTRSMTTALAYPAEPKKILMIGLGGGSISTYLGRAMPEAVIDTVEIDPGVIDAAKKYFGIRESKRVRYLAADGRVFLKRNAQKYDVILVDAFHGGYVPFHLLTKEFYELVKERLTPGGVAAFNVHDGTKLYVSTVKTLGDGVPDRASLSDRLGEVATVVGAEPAPADDVLDRTAPSRCSSATTFAIRCRSFLTNAGGCPRSTRPSC